MLTLEPMLMMYWMSSEPSMPGLPGSLGPRIVGARPVAAG